MTLRFSPNAEKEPVPTADCVEDFRSSNAEVHIRSRKWGDIWLVPRRTGSPRYEILPEEVHMLALARASFSGRIVEVRRRVPAGL